ncbi:MAG: hypothetical protein Q8P31_04265 [Bacillota bacterium]|nr:hypothetical protein [Bacillota bacterium]
MGSSRDSGFRNAGRAGGGKGRRQAAPDINLRDPFTLTILLLVLVIGFGAAYALWLRTWRLDQAREMDWYVNSSTVRIRDFMARTEVFFRDRNAASLALLTASANRLEGCLVQIPRRGPVEWRAEMVGLAEQLRSTFDAELSARLASPASAFAALADQMPVLRDRMREIEQALNTTVTRAGSTPQRTNWTPEVESRLRNAIAQARKALDDIAK